MQIKVFDFKKDWKLVEPHLKDSEVKKLLDKGMLRFSKRHDKWKHLPLWDAKNGHGPWQYTKFDTHFEYAFEKQMEDPEYSRLSNEYLKKLGNMGVDLDNADFDGDLFRDTNDEKIKKINLIYQEKFNRIESKYCPEKNSYRWYQCFGGCFYLAEWQEALARKAFPEYDWMTYQKRKKNPKFYDAGHSTTIGFSPQGDCLLFDILLFETETDDEILKAVGLNHRKIEEIAIQLQLLPHIASIYSSIQSIEINISRLNHNIRNSKRTNSMSKMAK